MGSRIILVSIGFSMLFCGTLFSQQNYSSDYSLNESQGTIPEDFLINVSQRVADEKEKSEDLLSDDNDKRDDQEDFLITSSASLEGMLTGGRVMFGDPLTNYVNKVADKIIDANPDLKGKFSFYTMRAGFINAFCTPQGKIFVNVEMLTRLEDEAMLAFVLCHEMSHYLEHHGLNQVAYQHDLKELRKTRKYLSAGDYLKLAYSRSKDHELEADRKGLELLSKTGYNIKSYEKLLHLFAVSEQVEDDAAFSKSYFESADFTIPACYEIDKVDEIEKKWDENDTYVTHPNNKARLEALKQYEASRGFIGAGNADFLVGKAEFDQVMQQAKFENINDCIDDLQYTKAFYLTYSLLQKYPNNKYLNSSMCKILYGLSKYKVHGIYYYVGQSYEDFGGQAQATNYFFKNLSGKQISAISLKKMYELRSLSSNPNMIDTLIQDLTADVFYEYSLTPNDLTTKATKYTQVVDNSLSPAKQRFSARNFYKGALRQASKSGIYNNITAAAQTVVAKKKKHDDLSYNDKLKMKKAKEKAQKKYGYGIRMTAENTVVVHPSISFRKRANVEKTLERMVNRETEFNNSLKVQLKKIGLPSTLYSMNNLDGQNVEYYNKSSFLRNWALVRTYGFNKAAPKNTHLDLLKRNFPNKKYAIMYSIHPYYFRSSYFKVIDMTTGKAVYYKELETSSTVTGMINIFEREVLNANK